MSINEFRTFFEKDVPAAPMKAEYLLPTLIGSLLRAGKYTVNCMRIYKKGRQRSPAQTGIF